MTGARSAVADVAIGQDGLAGPQLRLLEPLLLNELQMTHAKAAAQEAELLLMQPAFDGRGRRVL